MCQHVLACAGMCWLLLSPATFCCWLLVLARPCTQPFLPYLCFASALSEEGVGGEHSFSFSISPSSSFSFSFSLRTFPCLPFASVCLSVASVCLPFASALLLPPPRLPLSTLSLLVLKSEREEVMHFQSSSKPGAVSSVPFSAISSVPFGAISRLITI